MRKELTENIDLIAQLLIRDRLDKLLRRNRSPPIKLPQLSSGSPRHSQRLAFPNHLAHQSNLLNLGRIETTAGEQEIANYRIPQITLKTRNPAKARDQSQTQFRETKSRHLVGDNQIAH